MSGARRGRAPAVRVINGYRKHGRLAARRGQRDMLRGLPWWLGTFRREPKRRFVREGLRAAAAWALDRLRGRRP